MSSRGRLLEVALVLAAGFASACTVGPDGSFSDLQPLVFPSEGQLGASGAGSTAAIVLDSNYIDHADLLELYDLHRSRVKVIIGDPLGVFPDTNATVRSVFSLQASTNSNRHGDRPGSWMTVVTFDLPSAAALGSPTAFPFTVLLRVAIDEVVDFEPRFIITGDAGAPNPLVDAQFASANTVNESLQPRPTLRLRPKRAPGTFAPGVPTLGGLQFSVLYLSKCMTDVDAYPGTEAANGTAHVGPVLGSAFGYSGRRVMLVDPGGFNLTFLADEPPFDTTDETLAGEGPLLDLAVKWKQTTDPDCDLANASLLVLQDLVVSDVNGNQVFSVAGTVELDSADAPSASAVFRRYPIDIPPVPPPPGGGC